MPVVLCAAATLAAILVAAGGRTSDAPESPAAPAVVVTIDRGDRSRSEARRIEDPVAGGTDTGLYRAPVGAELRYGFRATSSTRLTSSQAASAPAVTIELVGTMRIVVAERTADAMVLALSFPQTRVSLPGAGAPVRMDGAGIEQDLARVTLVRARLDGQTLGYGFPADLRPEHRNWVRTLLSAFRFVVGDPSARSWQCEEADATGSYVAGYCWETPLVGAASAERPARLRKDKGAYRSFAPALRSGAKTSGVARATLTRQSLWLDEVRFTERTQVELVGMATTLVQTLDAEFHLEGTSLARPEPTKVRDWAPACGSDEALGPGPAQESEWAERLAHVMLAELVAEVRRLVAAGTAPTYELFEAKMKVVWLLRLRETALDEMRTTLLDPSLPQAVAAVLVTAVACVDKPAAMQLMADVLGDRSRQPALRLVAVRALIQLPAAPDSLLDSLRTVADDPREAHELRDGALLVLGALAQRAEHGVAGIVAELVAREETARAEGRLGAWLTALGNVQRADVLPHVSRYLRHPDALLRAAAVSALRGIDADGAATALAERALQDESAAVRGLAGAALASRATSSGSTLELVLRRDADAAVRLRVVRALAGRAVNRAAAQRLLDLAARDVDAGVRAAARDAISSSRHP